MKEIKMIKEKKGDFEMNSKLQFLGPEDSAYESSRIIVISDLCDEREQMKMNLIFLSLLMHLVASNFKVLFFIFRQ